MDVTYKTIKEIAEEWDLTVRRVQMLCTSGKIEGAKKVGNIWKIPADAVRPTDNRVVTGEHKKSTKISIPSEEYAKMQQDRIEFMSHMSHRIRTSLNGVLGSVTQINRHLDDPEKIADCLKDIEKSGVAILSLLNNALDVTRLENGGVKIEDEVCDIDALIRNLADKEQREAYSRGVAIVSLVDVKNNFVYTDKKKLSRILRNILNNGAKFSKFGDTVRIYAEEQKCDKEGYCRIRYTVSDAGVGMTEKFQEHIFDSFSMELNEEFPESGSGLGMAIVRSLVQALGGTIELESHKGFGTRVYVTIDHKIAEEPATKIDKDEELDVRLLKGKRVLLAEDNALNRKLTINMLRDTGMIIDVVEDGILCVASVEKAGVPYDLILMDVMMPNMDGLKATKIIRGFENEKKANVPIIAMSANVLEEDKQKAKEAGMNAFIEKPVHFEKMLKTIWETLK